MRDLNGIDFKVHTHIVCLPNLNSTICNARMNSGIFKTRFPCGTRSAPRLGHEIWTKRRRSCPIPTACHEDFTSDLGLRTINSPMVRLCGRHRAMSRRSSDFVAGRCFVHLEVRLSGWISRCRHMTCSTGIRDIVDFLQRDLLSRPRDFRMFVSTSPCREDPPQRCYKGPPVKIP